MQLVYTNIQSGKRIRVQARVTTEHAASSYGIPIVVLSDGESLDVQSWLILNYRVLKATPREMDMLRRALSPYATPLMEGN